MTRAEFNAIKKREADGADMPSEARAVIFCQRNGRPIHPDELGAEGAAKFKAYCEALALALKDRMDLLAMIDDFELDDYFDAPLERPDAPR